MPRNISWFVNHILTWVTLTHALLFIAFWLTNALFYASTNDYLTNMLAKRRDYVSLLMVISGFIAAGSATLGIMGILRKEYPLPAALLWVYALIALVYIVFFYGSFALLFKESPVQSVRLRQLIGYYRLFIDPVLLLGLVLLVAFWIRNILGRMEPAPGGKPWLPLALPMLAFVILWALALAFPPSSVRRGTLPDKPLLIAHRGASMLAPENTLAAAKRAIEIGVAGLETDIQVSKDGQEFLLHDDTFDRTTDIASVFPERRNEPAGNFSMAEIAQLNAGKWFVEQDPYGAIRRGLVTPAQIHEDEQQAVPLLSDWLAIVQRNHLLFIFDLKQQPVDDSSARNIFELTLQQLSQAELRPLVWFLVDDQQIGTLQQLAPGMVAAYGVDYHAPPPADRLKSLGYHLVNVEYGIDPKWIEQYHAAGLWVNVYTVDEPWQFSRLWIVGTDSITTSNAQVMASLAKPMLSLPYNFYILIWIVVGLAGLAILVGLIYPVLNK